MLMNYKETMMKPKARKGWMKNSHHQHSNSTCSFLIKQKKITHWYQSTTSQLIWFFWLVEAIRIHLHGKSMFTMAHLPLQNLTYSYVKMDIPIIITEITAGINKSHSTKLVFIPIQKRNSLKGTCLTKR